MDNGSAPGGLVEDAVVVTGHGSVRAPADTVVAVLGVASAAGTPSEALERCAARVAAMLGPLRAAVEAKDVQTARTAVVPEWVEGRPPRRHDATTTLRVTFRDVGAAAQAVADAMAAAGGDARLDRMGPALDDERAVAAQARSAAFEDARAKAAEYAGLAGRALGRVARIAEEPAPVGHPVRFAAMAARAAPVAPEVQPGEFEVDAEVTVTFQLVDA